MYTNVLYQAIKNNAKNDFSKTKKKTYLKIVIRSREIEKYLHLIYLFIKV